MAIQAGSIQYILEVVDKNTKKALANAEKAAKKAATGFGKADKAFQNMQSKMSKSISSFSGVEKALGALGVAFSVNAIKNFTVDAVESAAQFNQLSLEYNRMTQQLGINGSQLLAGLQEVSAGTVSNNDLILSSNRAMALGVGNNMQDITKLMEIARVRGRALGLDTTQAFDNIVTGIGRGSPLILDNLGIITKGWDEEAKAAGVAMDSQFILNKVIADGTKELEAMGEVQLTTAERFQQIKAQVDNTKTAVGNAFIPTVEVLIEDFFGLTKGVADNQARQDAFAKTIFRVSNFVIALAKTVKIIISGIVAFADTLVSGAKVAFNFGKDVWGVFKNLGKNISKVVKAIIKIFKGDFEGGVEILKNSITASFQNTSTAMDAFAFRTAGWGAELGDQWDSIGSSMLRAIDLEGFQPVSNAADKTFPQISKGAGGMADKLDEAGKKAGEAMKELKKQTEDSMKEAEQAIKEFADNNQKEQERLRKEIDSTIKQIADLTNAFNKANEEAQLKFDESATQIVFEATQKIADLQKQITEERKKQKDLQDAGDQEASAKRLAELNAELAKQQEIINTNKEAGIVTSEQLAEAERQASLDPLQALIERFEAEKLAREEAFNAELLKLEERKLALQESLAARKEEFNLFFTNLSEQDANFTTQFTAQLQQRETATIASINKLITFYNKLASAKAKAGRKEGGFKQGGFALPGFAEGGYTAQGNENAVAGVVHRGEWVMPKWMVNSMPSLTGALEGLRQGGAGQITNDNHKVVNVSVTNNGAEQSDFWRQAQYLRFMGRYI